MTKSRLGAVTVLNPDSSIHRIFTDGDLRRLLEDEGGSSLNKILRDLPSNSPYTIDASASLQESSEIFKNSHVDTIIVKDNGQVVGMLDIQDLLE
jgi:arabinose-5-phosphate isomerase